MRRERGQRVEASVAGGAKSSAGVDAQEGLPAQADDTPKQPAGIQPAIGQRLSISESSVKTYVRRAFEKLEVTSRSAAIAEAMRRGILQ